LNRSQC